MTAPVHITVAYSAAPREVQEQALTLPAGSTVRDALVAAGLLDTALALADQGGVGVWGQNPMPANNVTPDEAKALAAWVLSTK